MRTESEKTIFDTQLRMDSKHDQLKKFREDLCQRVIDRTKNERYEKAQHESLFVRVRPSIIIVIIPLTLVSAGNSRTIASVCNCGKTKGKR